MINQMTKKEHIQELIEKTSGAYSFDRYGEDGWRACIRLMLRRGYNEREIEAILRSKWMRWAGDGAKKTRYGHHNSADLARFLDTRLYGQKDMGPGSDEVNELVAGTFGAEG